MQTMAEPSVDDGGAEPLLALVQAYRRQECERLLAQAQSEARAVLAQARGEARQRVHSAVEEEKRWARSQLAAARAHLQTVGRRHQQEQTSALLAAAWERLGAALRQRWREPSLRRAWIEKLLHQAHEALPGGAWEIRHPQDLPEDELQAMRERVSAQSGEPPQLRVDAQLTAGLRISAASVVLDGTLEGLTGERTRLQGELLAALEAAP